MLSVQAQCRVGGEATLGGLEVRERRTVLGALAHRDPIGNILCALGCEAEGHERSRGRLVGSRDAARPVAGALFERTLDGVPHTTLACGAHQCGRARPSGGFELGDETLDLVKEPASNVAFDDTPKGLGRRFVGQRLNVAMRPPSKKTRNDAAHHHRGNDEKRFRKDELGFPHDEDRLATGTGYSRFRLRPLGASD